MMPLSILPPALQSVAALLPPAHIMQAMQAFAYGLPTAFNPSASVAVTAAGGLMSFVLAVFLFNWDRQNQARQSHPLLGLLAALPYVLAALLM
jgi:hypothetical protein